MLKNKKIGKKIEEIIVGEELTLTEEIQDKELLLYLGLTNDNNPLYIQHDYVSQTPYKKPIVPNIMLLGIVTSAVSKYFPGPGSHILSQEVQFPKPVYHYETIKFHFIVKEISILDNIASIEFSAKNDKEDTVLIGWMKVNPPLKLNGTEKPLGDS